MNAIISDVGAQFQFENFLPHIERHLRQHGVSTQDMPDALQEARLVWGRAQSTYNTSITGAFLTHFYLLLRNTLRDFRLTRPSQVVRMPKRRMHAGERTTYVEVDENHTLASGESPEEQAHKFRILCKLHEALDQLDDQEWRAIYLCCICELTLKDASPYLGLTVLQTCRLVKKAEHNLTRLMGGWVVDFGDVR